MSEPAATPAVSSGAFAPFSQPVYAFIWAATVLGNIGNFMRDVASSWLVTDRSASPAAVSMIQAVATLPVFLFAIPAGGLADILDGWGIAETPRLRSRSEWFIVESCAAHMRQHHRVSNAAADVKRETRQFHIGLEPPVVAHLLTLDLHNLGPTPEPLNED